MHHECIAVFTHQGVDFLVVAGGAQCCNDQSLCFATGKQGGTVRSGQYTGTDRDRTDGTVSRPSIRGSPSRIWERTIFASRSNMILPTSTESGALTPLSWASAASVLLTLS